MFYSNEEIDRLEKMIEIPGGESYVRRSAMALGDILIAKPELYKTFGVYWWAMKKALQKYFPGKAWFKGGYIDELMLERAWHGSLFRTVLAATYYQGMHPMVTSAHEWSDSRGDDHEYTLIDYDAEQ